MIVYLDPYKDAKHGKLKGDKKEVFFQITFDEGIFYKVDEGYVLLANVAKYAGVVRAYKPELELEPGICAIPIYNKEYEIWEKGKDGKSAPIKHTPSNFEKNLCAKLDLEIETDKAYQGYINFMPDVQISNLTNDQLFETLDKNCSLNETTVTGNLPTYEVNNGNYKKNSYNKVSLPEKVSWLKKELCSSVKKYSYNEEMSLIDITEQLIEENKENELLLAVYFDLLKAILA